MNATAEKRREEKRREEKRRVTYHDSFGPASHREENSPA